MDQSQVATSVASATSSPVVETKNPTSLPQGLTQTGVTQAGLTSPALTEEQKKAEKKKKMMWLWIGLGVLGGVGLITLIAVLASQGSSSNEPGSGQPVDRNQYKCDDSNGCSMTSCDPETDENCFTDAVTCATQCGNLNAYKCSSGFCRKSACVPGEDENCFETAEDCAVNADCELPADVSCDINGTRTVQNGKCVCWDGVEGDDCSSCAPGYGPKFPCCFLKQLDVTSIKGSDAGVITPHCIGKSYRTNSSEATKNKFRLCSSSEAGCYGMPSFNPDIKYTKNMDSWVVCEAWIYASNGAPYQIDPNRTYEQNEADFHEKIKNKIIVRDPVWCDPSKIDMATSYDKSRELFTKYCTSSFQVTDCALPTNTKIPTLYYSQFGPNTAKSMVHS